MNKPKTKKVKKYNREELSKMIKLMIKSNVERIDKTDLLLLDHDLLATQPQPIKEECNDIGKLIKNNTCDKCGGIIIHPECGGEDFCEDCLEDKQQSKDIEFEEIKEPSHPQGNPNEKYYMAYIGDCIKYAAKIVVNSLTKRNIK